MTLFDAASRIRSWLFGTNDHPRSSGPDQKYVALYEPRYVLQLARLLEQAGDRQAAHAEYRRFLELWKHADVNLPELAEARRALAVK